MESRKIVIGEGTEYPLNGLLTLPDVISSPVPAVVMVHGSGPSNMDEKVSPNAHITRTVFYEECGHEITETEVAQSQYINLTEEEFKEKIEKEGYQLGSFSSLDIIIYKQSDGICPEHYVIGEENGFINIYKIDENGETKLYDVTNIYLEYLPDEEKEKIKNTIELLGREELNLFLENLES